MHGDGTGLLRIQSRQTGTLERVTTSRASSNLRLNLEVDRGGEFLLSQTTTLLGVAPVTLRLDGVLRGVADLRVARGRRVHIGRHARILTLTEDAAAAAAGVTFSRLQLDPGSELTFEANTGADMVVGTLQVGGGEIWDEAARGLNGTGPKRHEAITVQSRNVTEPKWHMAKTAVE